MSERIDDARIRGVIVSLIGRHASLRDAREAGVHLVTQRERLIVMAMPIGPRLAQNFYERSVPRGSRITIKDLEQASYLGVIDGIDRFEPQRGVLVSTVITDWVNKHLKLEVERNHWSTVNPGKLAKRRYFGKNKMTEDEREHYEKSFMSGVNVDFDGDWRGLERTGVQL